MTRNQKIILAVVAGILVMCLIACVVGFLAFQRMGQTVMESAAQDPQEAAARAEDIADFTPPPGFTAETGIEILGISMVFFNDPAKPDTVIILMQMPITGELTDTTFDSMREAMERQSGRRLRNVQTIEDRAVTIRGEPARVVVQEGENSDGRPYRQMLAAFQGEDGLALLTIAGPTTEWDQAAFDQSVESIR